MKQIYLIEALISKEHVANREAVLACESLTSALQLTKLFNDYLATKLARAEREGMRKFKEREKEWLIKAPWSAHPVDEFVCDFCIRKISLVEN